jgi:hypothetical protein
MRKTTITKNTFAFCLMLLVSSGAFAATYYVNAISGSDSNNGTTELTAWKTISKVNSVTLVAGDIVLFSRGQTFRGNLYQNFQNPSTGSPSSYIRYGAYGTGNKPLFLASISRKLTSDWVSAGTNLWKTSDVVTIDGASRDAGNLIFNNEASVGWKVTSLSGLTSQGKFYSDVSAKTVTMYSAGNPGSVYSNIEIALDRYNIHIYNKSYLIIENLDLRYSASIGIQLESVHHIIVRDVDMSYIGGAVYSGETRLGNGLQFWSYNNNAHDCYVERCSFSQIYDAALTNQGLLGGDQYNLFYRNNIVRNCEYSFELWLNGNGSLHDIYFVNNVCLDAGVCWAHAQRPDPNATHLSFWSSAATGNTNIFIRNNIFVNSVGAGIYSYSKDLKEVKRMVINYNDWYNIPNILAICTGWNNGPVNTYYNWDYYRTNSGQDANSITTNPLLTPSFSIPSNSPCVNTGVFSSATTDFIGTSRPQDGAFDMGAYEYTTSADKVNNEKITNGKLVVQ